MHDKIRASISSVIICMVVVHGIKMINVCIKRTYRPTKSML